MPCLIAARLPIITRSLIVSRSHSAIAPTNVTNSLPIAVDVSYTSVALLNATLFCSNISSKSNKSRTLRVSLSNLYTKTKSNRLISFIIRCNSGRSRLAPEKPASINTSDTLQSFISQNDLSFRSCSSIE